MVDMAMTDQGRPQSWHYHTLSEQPPKAYTLRVKIWKSLHFENANLKKPIF